MSETIEGGLAAARRPDDLVAAPTDATPRRGACGCSVDLVHEGGSIALVRGELDLAAIDVVVSEVEPHLDEAVTVDLAGVTFLDGAGIRCLVALRHAAAARGGRVTVGAVSPAARRVLVIAGCDLDGLRC